MGVTLGPIGQIAHPVSDVDRAEAFYGNVLGLRKLYRYGDLTFFDCAGVSRPITVAAEAMRLMPPVPSAAGTKDRYENSFFHFTSRRKLMPHVCGPLPR